ncbi:MAG TPA: PIN domain-containing protein [Steroidobacteraceae bacterium]|nr:PIN domain-containing protein [Steroidobacteraceae bacterium]
MATNYVLVDFENVQPDSLEELSSGAFRVKVFVGANQAKGRVSFEFSESMQKLGSHAEYVRIARSGPNAVDMHIAYFVGRLLEKEPHAALFIISRDTDFDPLVEYLQAHGSSCRRVKSIAELTKLVPRAPVVPKSASRAAPPSPAKKAQSDRLAPIIKHLHSLRGKPSTRKTLVTTIGAYFKQHGGALADKVVEQLIDELIRLKYVSQAGPKVSYHLS